MDLRTARLTAWALVATVAVGGAATIAAFGPDAPFPRRFGPGGVTLWQPARTVMPFLLLVAAALATMHQLVLARARRWRRNLVRAGGHFAISWVAGPTLTLCLLLMGIATKLGYRPDAGAVMATLVGAIWAAKANLLTKSRPGWFNGLVPPIVAARPDIWRRVHRVSAWRGLAVAATLVALPWTGLAEPDGPIRLRAAVLALLLGDMAAGTLHALVLARFSSPKGTAHAQPRR